MDIRYIVISLAARIFSTLIVAVFLSDSFVIYRYIYIIIKSRHVHIIYIDTRKMKLRIERNRTKLILKQKKINLIFK